MANKTFGNQHNEEKTIVPCRKRGCKNSPKSRGYCNNHYQKRWRRKPEVKARIKEASHKYFRTPKSRYSRAIYCAKKRGKEWDITFQFYYAFLRHPCYYCGSSIASDTGSGMDRIDCSKGYLMKNVLPCCGRCNTLRSNKFTPQETKAMINALLKLRKSRQQSRRNA